MQNSILVMFANIETELHVNLMTSIPESKDFSGYFGFVCKYKSFIHLKVWNKDEKVGNCCP